MKLMIVVVNNQDSDALLAELSLQSIGATRLKSTGGFMRKGNTTFLIGVEDHRVNHVMCTIRKCCGTRMEYAPPNLADDSLPPGILEQPAEVVAGGATVWVVPMTSFLKLC